MYEHLKGKTLLVMDRTALAACAVLRAKELGIRTVVANFYKYEDSPSKQVADVSIDADISDIERMLQIVKDYDIDGIFVGWTDSHLPFYAQICEKAGLPCCGTLDQFDIMSNDKRRFKQACIDNGVPTTPSYKIDMNFSREDLDKIVYPVVIKPADGSGGRGVARCNNEEELISGYTALYESSRSKKLVCEKYIDSPLEIFLNYTIQDDYPSLSAAYIKHRTLKEIDSTASGLLHIYSPAFIDEYKKAVEPAVINMFRSLGLRNCALSFQGFLKDGEFYFHEAGLRMGGGQSYLFTQELNGISALDMVIEYALTGKMSSADVKTQDNSRFSKYCANYYVRLNSGTITSISGIEEVKNMPEVLQCLTFHEVGDVIASGTSVDRVIYRIHVMGDTAEDLANAMCRISDTLDIRSEKGEEMQMEHLDHDRLLALIIEDIDS